MMLIEATSQKTIALQDIILEIEKEIDRELSDKTINDSLISGKAGMALFYSQLYRQFNESRYLERACELITDCLISLEESNKSFDFASGVSGILWASKLMSHWGMIDMQEVGGIAEANEQIGKSIELDAKKNVFDFFYGFMGKGIYMIDPYPENIATIEKVIHHLDYLAIVDDHGITWEQTFLANRKLNDDPCYELGMAHGISAIIIFLSKAYQRGILKDKCKVLIEAAVSWILHKKGISKHNYLPLVVPQIHDSPKLAWCVGDWGTGAAIWTAGCEMKNKSWQAEVFNLLKRAAAVNFEGSNIFYNGKSSVADCGFCHGLAGNAYLFNRFYQATGLEVLSERANYWLTQLLHLRDQSKGALLGGFYSYKVESDQSSGWRQELGVLEGACGVGLTLMSFLSPALENPLDKIFLVDLPAFEMEK